MKQGAISIVADSSFFICFIDDIKKPQELSRILSFELFRFILCKIIMNEIGHCLTKEIDKLIGSKTTEFDYYEYGNILMPLFSDYEIKKGEHEVIVTSFILNFLGEDFLFILDDNEARKFVQNNFRELLPFRKGTVGFIKTCHCQYGIFTKIEVIDLLKLIDKSEFRIDSRIIINTIKEIEIC